MDPPFERTQRRSRIGKGLKLIGLEQFRLERLVGCQNPRQGGAGRSLGQCPEIAVVPGERQGLAVLEFGEPDLRHTVSLWPGVITVARNRGMYVE